MPRIILDGPIKQICIKSKNECQESYESSLNTNFLRTTLISIFF